MSSTITEGLLVDEVVSVLTNPTCGEDGATMGLKEQLQLAADEYDSRAAEAFGRALVDSLCEDPGNVRRLEALLILGLAHPNILSTYHVSLASEGRRLCVLLENAGESERARGLLEMLAAHLPEERLLQQDLSNMMRRNGDTDELVERCLERAEEAVQANKPMDAIPWLQEILLHDQSRRDVARMIRDLRYQEMDSVNRRRRRNRMILLLVVVSTTLSSLFVRESKIRMNYSALPPVVAGKPQAIGARIAGLDHLIADNNFWFGMFDAVGERSELQEMQDKLGAKEAGERRERIALDIERQAQADAARLKGIDAVMAANYEDAKALFREALALGKEDWPRRERIKANIAAIEDLLQQQK